MALSSLFTGISGLTSFSTSMSVIGNNLANVNTNGFKAGRVGFSDILSQSLTGSTGEYQIGRGVELNTVDLMFGQGSFETSSSPTDLAIDGDGFFVVKDPNGTYYTRSGMYIFDTNGDLVNPNGYALQGWRLDASGQVSGTLGNINIGAISSSPNATSTSYFKLNVDSRVTVPALVWDDQDPHRTSNYSSSMTVYDSLGREHMATAFLRKTAANTWAYDILVNASEVSAVHYSSENRSYIREAFISTTTTWGNIARETATGTLTLSGTNPDGTAIAPAAAFTLGGAGALNVGDLITYINANTTDVTASLTTDGRIQVQDTTGAGPTGSLAIALAQSAGGINFGTFAAANNLLPATAVTGYLTTDRWMMTPLADISNPIVQTTRWAEIGAGSHPADSITLTGTDASGAAQTVTLNLSPVAGNDANSDGNYDIQDLLWTIENTFGNVTARVTPAGRIIVTDNTDGSNLSIILARNSTTGSTLDFGSLSADTYHQAGTAGTLAFTTNGALNTETPTAVNFGWLGGATAGSITFDFGDSITTEGGTGLDGTTQFASNSATLFQSQDGYSSGHMVNLSVNTNGEVTGLFSNGTSMSIYKIALSNFASPWQLNQVGKNLFAESEGSGQPIIGVPGSSGLGQTASNSLEMSNVDIATEFVNLIKTQQAFQANSRIITTTDQMLQDIINLKR